MLQLLRSHPKVSIEKRSLVLHYDEDREEIVFLSIPGSVAVPLRNDEGVTIPLSEVRSLYLDEAERRIGEGVFSMLDSFATRKTEIRDYACEMNKDIERMIVDLESVAVGGDPQAQYDLSVLYRELARRQLSWAHFEKAESLTRAAAAAGLPTAVDALGHWDTLRNAFTRVIERGTAS